MKRLATILATCLALPAYAQTAMAPATDLPTPSTSKWLPPPEYDKPYTGKVLLIERGDAKEMAARCPKTIFPVTLACSWRKDNGERCEVLIANDDILKRYGWIYEHI